MGGGAAAPRWAVGAEGSGEAGGWRRLPRSSALRRTPSLAQFPYLLRGRDEEARGREAPGAATAIPQSPEARGRGPGRR